MENQPNCKTCLHKGTDFYYGLCPQDDSEILPQEGNRCYYYEENQMNKNNDIADLVWVTITDLVTTGTLVSVSPIGGDKLQATINGKEYNFTLAELMGQKYSAKGFINLIKGRIR